MTLNDFAEHHFISVFMVTLWNNGVQLAIFQSSDKSFSDPNYIKFIFPDRLCGLFSICLDVILCSK